VCEYKCKYEWNRSSRHQAFLEIHHYLSCRRLDRGGQLVLMLMLLLANERRNRNYVSFENRGGRCWQEEDAANAFIHQCCKQKEEAIHVNDATINSGSSR